MINKLKQKDFRKMLLEDFEYIITDAEAVSKVYDDVWKDEVSALKRVLKSMKRKEEEL